MRIQEVLGVVHIELAQLLPVHKQQLAHPKTDGVMLEEILGQAEDHLASIAPSALVGGLRRCCCLHQPQTPSSVQSALPSLPRARQPPAELCLLRRADDAEPQR